MNTTKIYEPDEQDDPFQMATWHGDADTPSGSIREDDKLKLRGWENSFEIMCGYNSLELDKEDIAGLKHMLDEYETWLEEH